MDEGEPPQRVLGQVTEVFAWVEHGAYIALGGLLSLTALLGLIGAGTAFMHGLGDWGSSQVILQIIDRLLFVLMVVEILHTVRASIRSGALTCEPFLVVGLIATIRRVLVITLRSSETTKDGFMSADAERFFHASLMELLVLALLIVVMVVSIRMLRPAKVSV